MTDVSFESYYDTYIFQCVGHSGYSVKGADVICSAVSVLCYTLEDYLEKCETEGRIWGYTYDFSDGYVRMEFESNNSQEAGVLEGIYAILGGFRLLSENFPEYVSADF